jgi:type II secretion system protein D
MRKVSLILSVCAVALIFCISTLAQQTKTNAAAPAPAKPGDKNIRFHFDGIPYADVVERFAQMAGKPLVSDTNVQGTLTYNDQRAYTYEEALDTLNVMLSMKGVMLVEDGNYLRLVPFKQLPQLGIKILRGLEQAGDVRPSEIVTVVLDVNNLDSKEVADAVQAMVSNAGSIAPLSRGRGLIITDRLANIQRIRSLLSAIDIEAVADRQMKAFTLLHSSGAVVADLINRTFGLATAPKRTQYNPNNKNLEVLPPDPNDYITAVFDDASRTLVLFGPRNRISLAEDLISKFEDKEGGGGEVRIYYPQVTKAEELAQMIRQAIPGIAAPGETAAAAATKARVIADNALNRLIVAAPVAGQLDQIEQLVNRLDKPVHGTGGTFAATKSQTVQVTKVFRPRASDAASVAKILSEALSKRLPSGQTISQANVTVEPNSHSVVVTGSPGDIQLAVDIVTQLETGSSTPTPQQTKFIDVGGAADAKRLLPLIEQIYRSQVTDSLGGQVAHAKILADTDTGRLIVTASDDHLRRIENIVEQLKKEKITFQDRKLQIITPKYARMDAVFTSINNLVSERMNDKRFADVPKPMLVPDNTSNRLLVTATDEQFREIQQVVNVFDVAPEKTRREMTVIPVQSKSAQDLISLTTELMRQLGEDQSNPQLAPKLIPDSSGKQIIVLATAKDVERITNLMQRLDTASATVTSRQFKSIELSGRTAMDFTKVVEQLYSEQLKGQMEPAGGPATLIPEPKQNRIMVSGSDREITRVEAIIRQLDPLGQKGFKDETRVIRLKSAVAADLAALVEKSLNAQSQQIKVLVDPRSNSLVLTGDNAAVESAAAIINQLDTRSEVQPRELRIIELKQGDAATITPMVNTLFADMVKDQRGPEYVPQTKIVPDPAANRLILTGPKDELTTVAQVVERLDQQPETAGGARVFKVLMADAGTLAPIVSNAMLRFDTRNMPIRRVTVSADRESNSIIVSGSRADLQDAEKIIERLDHEGEKGRTLKVVDVNTDDPDALAALALKVFSAQNTGRNAPSLVTITPASTGKRLLVLAPESLLPQIESVITTLDTKPDQGVRELQTIEIKNASASEILSTVNRIYGEQTQGKSAKPASIYQDSTGTRIMVYGTKDQAASVRQIVETVQGQQKPGREMRAFDIGAATEVQRLLPIIQQIYQEQWKGQSDPADAQFVADAPGGRLIVSGKPDHLTKIEAILKQLNTGKPRSDVRDTRVYDLTTANATDLASTVRTLYTEQSKNRLGAATADTLILPDASANRLLVSGDTNELALIEGIIQKLDKVSAQSASTRVFKLKSAEPDKVAEILSNALVRYDANNRQQRRVSVVVDAKSRAIIATGDPKELQGASVIIEQLDSSLGAQPERKMKVLAVKNGRVNDLSSKVRQLYLDQAKAQPELGASEPLIMEDSSSNQFVLAGSENQINLIERILGELQAAQASAEPVETRVYDLTAASASDLVSTVRSLHQEQNKGRVSLNPAMILPDVTANRIIVTGITNDLNSIEQIITKLDKANVQTASTRVFKLKSGEADQIASVLSSSLSRLDSNGRSIPRVTVGADNRTSMVVVSGDPKDLQAAASIIEQFDSLATKEQRQMRIMPLKSGVATDLALRLRQLYLDQMKGKGQTGSADALIMGDDLANRLIIAASESHMKVIEEVAKQLQEGGEGSARQIQVVSLKHIAATPVASMISQLFAPQIASTDPGQKLIVSASPDDRTLLVDANAPTLNRINQLIQTLDKSETEGQAIIQTVHLKKAAADTLAEAVSRAITARGAQSKLQKVSVTPVMGANALLLNGPGEQVQEVMKIVRELDNESTGGDIEVRIYKLKSAEAKELVPILEQLLQSVTTKAQLAQPNVRIPPPSVAIDQRANTLLVSASPAHFKLIEQLLPTLDQTPERSDRDVQFIWLKNAKAWDIVTKLSAVFEGRAAADKPVIDADTFSNSITVIGKRADIAQIQELVNRLDDTSKDTSLQVRLRPLDRVPAEQMARMLKSIYPQMSSGQVRVTDKLPVPGTSTNATNEVVIAVDKDANAILLSGPTQELDQIDRIISELSYTGITGDAELHIFQLKEADPIVVARTLNQLFRTEQPQQAAQQQQQQPQPPPPQNPQAAPREPKMTVVAEPRTRSIIVRAKPTEFTLLESLIRQLDSPGATPELSYRLIRLTNSPPEDVVPLVQQMVTQLRLMRPGDPLSVMPDSRSDSLLVIAQPGTLDQLEKIVRSFDTPSPYAEAEVLVITLKQANAPQLASILQSMLRPAPPSQSTQEARQLQEQIRRLKVQDEKGNIVLLDLSKPIRVMADPLQGGQGGGNRLILSSTADNLKALSAVVGMMDSVPLGETEVKLFRLKHASATRIAPLLQSVFAEGPPVPGTEGLNTQITRLRAALEPDKAPITAQPKSRAALIVQADDTANILIIAARADTLPLIEAVVNQLDIPSASGLDSLRIYPLKHADATTFQKVVNDIFSGPRAAQLRTEDRPNVTIDERTQALIVSGNSKALAIIDSLLMQLDTPLALDLRDVRILPLQHADATDLAANLQRLLDARVTQKGSLSKQQADALRVLVLGEPRSNSILLAGSKDSFELVESLAKELDKAPTALSGKIRLVPLTYADARNVSSALINLFNQRYQSARSPEVQRNKPVIVPDMRGNSLLIAAAVDDNAVIDELLQKLDRKLEDPALTLSVVQLKHNDAGRLATTLESIFTARIKARTLPGIEPSPQDQVKIETDSLNNALIVSASKDNMEVLRGLLEKVDIEPSVAGGILQTFTLQFADAQRVANMLQSLVQQGLYRPGVPVATQTTGAKREAMAVTVDPRSNTLIVSASPENLAVIREIIKQVDSKDFAEKANIRLYSLKHAKASSLATVLEQFFRAKRAGDAIAVNAAERSVPVAVIPDDRANTLLVTGSKESFDILDRIIAQLDSEDAMSRMNFRVFPLKQTTAGKLQDTLQKLFVSRPSRVKGEPPDPITVVADPWVNALLVGASVDDMSMVASLIERLDSEQAQLGLTVQVFPLAKAVARQVAQTVQGLYREGTPGTSSAYPIMVSADERLNAIVVSAGEADLKRIGELVKKLDTDNVARVSEIRVFGLKYASASSLSTILNTALNTKPTAMSEQSPNAASVLQFITRTDGGSQLVTSALKEGVLITPDSRMNSLIISAPVDYMGLLEQIIARLDSSAHQEAKIKVFALANADARQMAELLMAMFRLQPQTGPTGQNNPRSIQYTLVRSNGPQRPAGDKPHFRKASTFPNGDDFIGPQLAEYEEEVASATIGTAEQGALNVTVDPRTNSLLVGGTEHYVALVSQVIESLDSSEGQERRSQVYRLKNAQAKEVALAISTFLDQERKRVTQVLGADAVGTAQRMLEQEVAIVAEETSNALLLSANPRYFSQITNLIDDLDQPQPQVLIQVLLAEVSLDAARDLGIEWNLSGSIGAADIFAGTDLGLSKLIIPNIPRPGAPAPSPILPGTGLAAAVTGDDFSFILRALEDEGRLEVLSRPQILTADNRPAAINVGQRVPFITNTRITEQNTQISTVEYQSVGINLSVTPRIGPDGSVKMDIGTTNSALTSSSISISPGVNAPIINERRATTTVSVQSGQSILLGGLISTTDDKRLRKVPFLGDIPLFGNLFRSSRRIMDRKELLILLTPQVLVNVRSVAHTMDVDAMTDKQLRESTLQDQFQKDEFKERLLEPLLRSPAPSTNGLPSLPPSKNVSPFHKDDEI